MKESRLAGFLIQYRDVSDNVTLALDKTKYYYMLNGKFRNREKVSELAKEGEVNRAKEERKNKSVCVERGEKERDEKKRAFFKCTIA
jgi:hypothetical protein